MFMDFEYKLMCELMPSGIRCCCCLFIIFQCDFEHKQTSIVSS